MTARNGIMQGHSNRNSPGDMREGTGQKGVEGEKDERVKGGVCGRLPEDILHVTEEEKEEEMEEEDPVVSSSSSSSQ